MSAPESFVRAYIECALWSSNDYFGEVWAEPLDKNYDEGDIAPETLARMRADCDAFCDANAELLAQLDSTHEQDGHDFWLTRNGHGAGFWDRGYGELGDALSAACKAFGGVDLYVGDDGKVHGS